MSTCSSRTRHAGDRDAHGRPAGRDRGPALPIVVRASVAAAAAAILALSSLPGPRAAGASDDPRDWPYVMDQLNQVLETQRTAVENRWANPATGTGGTIVVERTFYRGTGEPCRDYRRTVERTGDTPLVYRGTGCRVAAGLWRIDETAAAAPDPVTAAPTVVPRRAPPKPRAAAPRTPQPAAAEAGADAAAPAPAVTAAGGPNARPAPFTAYTLPPKTEL